MHITFFTINKVLRTLIYHVVQSSSPGPVNTNTLYKCYYEGHDWLKNGGLI